MKIIFLFLCVIIFFSPISSQYASLSIEYGSWSNTYKGDKIKISKAIFDQQLSMHPTAYSKFKSGKVSYNYSKVLSYIGGFLIGYNIGDVMVNKNKDFTKGGIGLGLLAISFPLSYKGKHKMESALEIYNHPLDVDTFQKTKSKLVDVDSDANKLKQSCIVVRIPTSGSKIKYYRTLLAKPNIQEAEKTNIQQKLDETIRENWAHFDLLKAGFSSNYDFSPIYFVPDTLFKAFLAGKRDHVFINQENVVDPSIDFKYDNYYLMLHLNSIDQLIITGANGQKLDKPFPYKKTTFFPSFKRIFEPKNYINDQIKWFDKKLKSLSY